MKTIADCKYLTVKAGVVLNDLLTSTICDLDNEFGIVDVRAVVTSGIRTTQKQLSIIVEKAKLHGIDKEFPEILVATVDNVDSWIKSWGKLLVLQDVVNPPIPARAPFDYVKPNGDKRNAGTLIDISNHQKAHSFDIGKADLDIVAGIIHTSIELKRCPTIKGYLKEPVNEAVHVDCRDIKLDVF